MLNSDDDVDMEGMNEAGIKPTKLVYLSGAVCDGCGRNGGIFHPSSTGMQPMTQGYAHARLKQKGWEIRITADGLEAYCPVCTGAEPVIGLAAKEKT